MTANLQGRIVLQRRGNADRGASRSGLRNWACACLAYALLTGFPIPRVRAALLTSSGDWHNGSNWDTGMVPASVDTVYINSSLTATISSGNSGEADIVYIADGAYQAGALSVAGSIETGGDMLIGRGTVSNPGPTSRTANGVFTLADAAAAVIGGNLSVGAGDANGVFNHGAGASVDVGGNLNVGIGQSSGFAGDAGAASTYTVPVTGTLAFSGIASSLSVAVGTYARGTFTYNNPTDALMVPGNVLIGQGTYLNPGPTRRYANGIFTLAANAALDIGGNFTIGGYTASATFNHGDGASVAVGGNLIVGGGYNNTTVTYSVPETGILTLDGPASSLLIAAQAGSGRGTFAYNNPDVPLAIPGNVVIGQGERVNPGPTSWHATGTLDQGANTIMTISGNLTVGSSYTLAGNGGVFNIGEGALVTVTGGTAVATGSESRGRLHINVGDSASGLILGSSLTVGGDGLIDITFAENPLNALLGTELNHTGIHYGLKWAGNQVSTLTSLEPRLTWNDEAYLTGDFYGAGSIFYDIGTDTTYVGFYIYEDVIPEPASLALLVVGTACWLTGRRGVAEAKAKS
jgi:hypothetical protein